MLRIAFSFRINTSRRDPSPPRRARHGPALQADVLPVFDQRIVALCLCIPLLGGMSDCGDRPSFGDEPDTVEELGKVDGPGKVDEKADGGASAKDDWLKEGWPLMKRFCVECHNADYQEAELDLSDFESMDRLRGGGGAMMQRVLEMVRFGAMPPEDAALPTDEQRKTLVRSLDRTLFAVSCDLRPRPGKVTARRLNRTEYNHSIRDLFGIDLKPAAGFPSDEVGAGFDNNGDVLSLSPMMIEKYLDAAEQVSKSVLIDPATLPRIDEGRPGDQLYISGDVKTGRFNGRFLAKESFAWADFEVPVSGEYRVRLQGGNARKGAGQAGVAIYRRDGILLQYKKMGYYGGSGSSDRFDFKVKLEKGKHRFFIDPVEGDHKGKPGETRSEKFSNLDPDVIRRAEKSRKALRPDDRFDYSKYPFMVRRISVEGPTSHPKELMPPSQQQILRRTAAYRDERWHDVRKSATECLQPLMRRAFRGPVGQDEVTPYAELVVQATERGQSYYRGMQIAISAVLMSPRFLFRVETPPDSAFDEKDVDVGVTPHQLATRLSYFLWSSSPDEALLADADRNRLNSDRLAHHVRRMIADGKADSLATEFAAQWLGLRNLDVHEVDEDRFETFTPPLKQAMRIETERLFLHVARNNRPVAELLTADYTFLNEVLAKHYEIQGVRGKQFRQVSTKGTPRRGILSHAGILTLTSNPARTSPVKRGKWVLINVLGTPPPEPPAGVPELEETKTADANATLREQLEIHRADPSCSACHRVMDQLGFGLEQFDAIGRFRTRDHGAVVDASGELPGRRNFNGAVELSNVLGKSESAAFARTVTERLLTFALGRELTPADRCTVDEIVQKTSGSQHRFIDLVLEVVQSRPFQYYEWSTPSLTQTEQ